MLHAKPLICTLLGLLTLLPGCRPVAGPDASRQGWNADQRQAWYFATQGSRLMPLSWFQALERSDAPEPFGTPASLSRFGFLAPPAGSPRDLPIGFAVDRQDDERLKVTRLRWYQDQAGRGAKVEPWVGLNCAACHTARVDYQGQTHVLDGGPSLVDFQSFVEDLDRALHAARSDADRWDRFARTVLDGRDTAANRALLTQSFDRLLDWQDRTAQMNETPLRYGSGRLDAVGHIFNKVLMFNGAPAQAGNPPNAPVSYPFLWGISRQERVQWNGIARNSRLQFPGDDMEYGALGRNTGEVLGVFGEVVVTPQPPMVGQLIRYGSSVRTRNLVEMELLVKDLQSPAWPDTFPAIDAQLRDRGDALFDAHCADCHLPRDQQQPGRPTERMQTFQSMSPRDLTDIWMACNAFIYAGPTGPMAGVHDNDGNPMGRQAPVATMLGTAVRGTLIGDAPNLVRAGFANFLGIRDLPVIEDVPFDAAPDPRAADRLACLTARDVPTLAYKARPLDGIWATAPYLHNGSVRTLYELLLPPAQRSRAFWTGNREFDPVEVGFVDSDPGDGRGFLLRTHDEDGQVIEGNSNAGHSYGAENLTDEDRRALIEYMKSL